MNPVDNPKEYDFFVLAGQRSPGRARFSFPTLDEGWDKQEAKGGSGGGTVHNGAKLLEFDVELYLWKESWTTGSVDHFADWDAFQPLFKLPVAEGTSKALDIYHPQLDGLGITSVVVKSWTQPQPDDKGGATVKIKFLQYQPIPKKAGGSPSGSKANGAGGANGAAKDPAKADPNAALKQQVAELTKEFEAA